MTGIVCDGSDTDGQSFGCILWNGYQLDSSVIRYVVQGFVGGSCHLWYNNLWEHVNFSFDGISHTNTFECQAEWPGANYFHDMVFRNNSSGSLMWVCPNASDVYWNIVSYSNGSQPWDYDSSCGNPTVYFYNSTFADEGSIGKPGSWPGVFTNMLFINAGIVGTPSSQTNVISVTDAQATAAGLTPNSTYAYQPQSANCNGHNSPTCLVGAGTNLTSAWPGGFSTGDTSFACTYDSTNHVAICPGRNSLTRPASGAWDIGAYQFTALSVPSPPPPPGPSPGPSPGLMPPTKLVSKVQ
jgi:hypothetical protein